MANGAADAPELRDIDASVPHSARIWNYWLGGKDNFAGRPRGGRRVPRRLPRAAGQGARGAATSWRAPCGTWWSRQGVRQFLDVGTGLPTADNTHEVAQRLAPESRIVYVDNDPLVLAHARDLLTSSPEGVTNYIDADLHDPESDPRRGRPKTLDLDQPVALLLIGVLGHVADYDEARAIVRAPAGRPAVGQLPGAVRRHRLEPGLRRGASSATATAAASPTTSAATSRSLSLYEGLELVEPGIVPITRWRPEPNAFGDATDVDELGGVARKA